MTMIYMFFQKAIRCNQQICYSSELTNICVNLLLQIAGEIGKERHAVLSFLQKSCSTLQLRILVHNVMLLYAFSAVSSQHSTAFQKGNAMIAAGWLWQTSTTISFLCLVLTLSLTPLAPVTMMDGSDKLSRFCQDFGAHCPRIFHLLFEVWVPQGHCCEPWLKLEVPVDRSSIGHQILKPTKRIQTCKVLVARVCFHGVCPWLCADVPWPVFPILLLFVLIPGLTWYQHVIYLLSQRRISQNSDMIQYDDTIVETMPSQDAPALYQLPNEIRGVFAMETIYLQLLVWIVPSRWVIGYSLQTNLLLSVPSICAFDWIQGAINTFIDSWQQNWQVKHTGGVNVSPWISVCVFSSDIMSLKLAWRMTSFPSSSRCRLCTAGPWECTGWSAIGVKKRIALLIDEQLQLHHENAWRWTTW